MFFVCAVSFLSCLSGSLEKEAFVGVVNSRDCLQMETCPHETVASNVIGDFLYGDTVDDVRIPRPIGLQGKELRAGTAGKPRYGEMGTAKSRRRARSSKLKGTMK